MGARLLQRGPMKNGCCVLDLCCGGGFFAHRFFSSRAKNVVSVDFDPEAIAHAKANFHAPNVEYRCADIRTDMPEGSFDNIVWDAAIEHFTLEETAKILLDIKRRLEQGGVLSGYTLVEKVPGEKALLHHEYGYKSKEKLAGILKRSLPTSWFSKTFHMTNSRTVTICTFMHQTDRCRSTPDGQTW